MFSQRKFYVHMKNKYNVDFIVHLARQNIEELSELIISDMIELELYENEKYERYDNMYDELYVRKKSIFESTHFAKYLAKQLRKEVVKSQNVKSQNDIVATRIICRAYNCIRDFNAQKKSMMQNKSKYADIDIILAVLETADEYEVANMYVTVKALQDKLDPQVYKKLREFARNKFRSCRINARYFLYILRQVDKFENDEENVRIYKEEQQQKEHSKTNISNKRKDIEVSESDYKRYERGEKLEKKTKYKLYLYRQKYFEELQNVKLIRLTRDDLLFFLVNTEMLVENESLTIDQVLRIIKYADSNKAIINPRGWLIARFMISRGRFYFLLRSKSENKNNAENEKNQKKEPQNFQNQKQKQDDSVYIREDLLYFAKKYSVPPSKISKYVDSLRSQGDVSIAVEQYLISYIWKNRITADEKAKLIDYAKKELKKFVTPPKPEEIESYMKSIIRNEIKSRYLTLSIEDKIRLSNQYYDTS